MYAEYVDIEPLTGATKRVKYLEEANAICICDAAGNDAVTVHLSVVTEADALAILNVFGLTLGEQS